MINKGITLLPALLLTTLFATVAQAEIIHSERSLYRNVIVEDNANIRCLKFSVKRKTSSQSCVNKTNPTALVFNYTKLLFSSLLLLDEPKNVLIIGLGGGTMSNSIHQLFPKAQITNVEIDPAVVNVARKYFNFIENKQITTEIKDGRIFIKRAKLKGQQFDWVILDAFNGDYIPEHLMTQEFLQEVRAVLTDNGVISANTFSTSELYDFESATYHAVFGDFYNVRLNNYSNRTILTTKAGLISAERITQRAEKLFNRLKPYDINSKELSQLLTSEIDWPENTRLLTDQYSPANLLK